MNLEKRKLKEIEHSRKRRIILQGYERLSDTHCSTQIENLDELISDKEAIKEYFSNMKYYSITSRSEEYLKRWMEQKCRPGLKILDFACGNGENGIYAAKRGAYCVGIDISPEGIDNAINNASDAGVTDHCRFEVMDGESMTFGDDTFDLGVEYGALHHVDLDIALAELRRVLKPNSEMICVEALRHNPFIHMYRKRTPKLRTEWEVNHILGIESLKVMQTYFDQIQVKYFHLAAIAAVSFRKTILFKSLLKILNIADDILLSSQRVGKYGWIMIIILSKPIK